jgi:hypothetical protein
MVSDQLPFLKHCLPKPVRTMLRLTERPHDGKQPKSFYIRHITHPALQGWWHGACCLSCFLLSISPLVGLINCVNPMDGIIR